MPRRSILVLPGHVTKMHMKARGITCDEVVFDLEDAVAPSAKEEARALVVAELGDPAWEGRGVAVRVNARDTQWFEDDCAALRGLPASLVLPKATSAGDVVEAHTRSGLGVQALIETPAGVAAATPIAAAAGCVALIIGYADLAAALGRRGGEANPATWLVAQEAVLAAARLAGIEAIDGPFLGLGDRVALLASARTARDLGFDGKWAIHPEQLDLIAQLFEPSEREIAAAQAIVDTLDAAAGEGGDAARRLGAGMVDEASRRHAERILSGAQTGVRSHKSQQREGAKPARRIASPFYEDLPIGATFTAPGVTVDAGTAAVHRAITGSRLPLALDAHLSQAVTGHPEPLAHPGLVADLVIGQSTQPSGRVIGNLFYRGLILHPVQLGTSLRTTTTISVRRRVSGKRPRGIVALRVNAVDQDGNTVVDFHRAPMLPARELADEPAEGSLDDIPDTVDAQAPDWDLAPLRQFGGPFAADLAPGDESEVEAAETVSGAMELARLTLNLAHAHTDATQGPGGRRLVYGGHVIDIALAHVCRALPALATVIAWRSCDHLGPTFESDRLTTRFTVEAVDGNLITLRVHVDVHRDGDAPQPVLDWRPVVVLP